MVGAPFIGALFLLCAGDLPDALPERLREGAAPYDLAAELLRAGEVLFLCCEAVRCDVLGFFVSLL